MDYKKIGQRIREERKKLNITREKLAEILDLSVNYLGQLERGEKKFSAETILKIADSLHISLDYLIRGDINTPTENQKNELQDLLYRCSKSELSIIINIIKSILPHLKSDRH